MAVNDASTAQYGTPTPTTCVACATAPPPHDLPSTGLDIAPILGLGLVLIVVGLLVRARIGGGRDR